MGLFGFKNDFKINICYLNSILQCLIRIPKLNHIWCTSHSEDCAVVKELKKLSELCGETRDDRKVEELVKQSQSVIVGYLPEIIKNWQVGNYYDAHEVLTGILNLDSVAVTAVKNLIQFECCRKVTCHNCRSSATETIDPLITLLIHPSKISNSTLSEAISAELNHIEQLDQYKCENCSKDCKAESNYHARTLPDILIIQINCWEGIHPDPVGNKIRVSIQISINQEPMYEYDLKAVVLYFGNRRHYVTYVNTTFAGWVSFDDHVVHNNMELTSDVLNNGYILFYQKTITKSVHSTCQRVQPSDTSKNKPNSMSAQATISLFGFENNPCTQRICYLNCILQCLIRIPRLNCFWRNSVSSYTGDCILASELRNLSDLCAVGRKVQKNDHELWEKSHLAIVNHISTYWKFALGVDQDSHKILLDILSSPSVYETNIRNIIQFEAHREVKCAVTSETDLKSDTLTTFSIHPSKIYHCTPNDISAELDKTEKLSKYVCKKCKNCCNAVSHYYASTLPEILIIHFNRFYVKEIMVDGIKQSRVQKVTSPIKNIEQLCINQENHYDLKAVVSHIEGHYVSYVYTSEGWIECDDKHVKHVDRSRAKKKSKQAYILFYQKSDSSHADQDTYIGQRNKPSQDTTNMGECGKNEGARPACNNKDAIKTNAASEDQKQQNLVNDEIQISAKIHEYLEKNCPGWKSEKLSTFLVPPVFQYHHPEMPQEAVDILEKVHSETNTSKSNPTTFPGKRVDISGPKLNELSKDVVGQSPEEKVLNAFYDFGMRHAQPMVIFHSITLSATHQPKFGNVEDPTQKEKEKDLIILHRHLGIILVETKAKKTYNDVDARRQLDNAMKTLCNYLDTKKLQGLVKKVIAFPNLALGSLQQQNTGEVKGEESYIYLCSDHLSSSDSFEKWWKEMIINGNTNHPLIYKTYLKLVPILVLHCNDKSLNLMKIAEKIDKQQSLIQLQNTKTYQIKTENNGDYVKTRKCLSNSKKKIKETPKWTYEQCEVLDKKKQVICGPYGTGKTILIQTKAAELAAAGEKVLVIVPCHLVKAYHHVLQENIKFITLISTKIVYDDFETFRKLVQSNHVFVDEMFWSYVCKPFSMPLYYTTIRKSCADILKQKIKKNYSWPSKKKVSKSHSWPCIEKSGSNSKLKPKPFYVEKLQESLYSTDPERCYEIDAVDPEISKIYIECSNCSLSSIMSNYDFPIKRRSYSVTHLCEQVVQGCAEIHHTLESDQQGYDDLCRDLSSQSSDEGNDDDCDRVKDSKFLSVLHDLLVDKRPDQYVWIAPHMYVMIRYLLELKPQRRPECGVSKLIKMLSNNSLPVSTLTIAMRTTKQIHDFKVKWEKEEFELRDPTMYNNDANRKIFEMTFHNNLGHSISGPPVIVIPYPAHCIKYGVEEKPEESNAKNIHFNWFCARVIFDEIHILLGKKPSEGLKLRDIAIIGDGDETYYVNLLFIKKLLELFSFKKVFIDGVCDRILTFCTINEHLAGKNAITICYSGDIASLEWPVVVHIMHTQQNEERKFPYPEIWHDFPYLFGDHSVIISRCKVSYILICRENDVNDPIPDFEDDY